MIYLNQMIKPKKPPQWVLNRIKERLRYDAVAGVIQWVTATRRNKIGDRAGHIRPDGYVDIAFEIKGKRGRHILGHHAAWFLYFGEWPRKQIDHIDGNPSNLKLSNLRESTQQQNLFNARVSKNNKLGEKGVVKIYTGQ